MVCPQLKVTIHEEGELCCLAPGTSYVGLCSLCHTFAKYTSVTVAKQVEQ